MLFCVSTSEVLNTFGSWKLVRPHPRLGTSEPLTKPRPHVDPAQPPRMSLAEKNRERANIVTQKKWRPLNLGLIGRQKRVFRARAGREKRHESGHIFG
jgi:hypothetical protein